MHRWRRPHGAIVVYGAREPGLAMFAAMRLDQLINRPGCFITTSSAAARRATG